MVENILVIGMIVLVALVCVGGWLYENFGPEADSSKKDSNEDNK